MGAQKWKKMFTEIFDIFECLLTENPTKIKIHNSLDSFRPQCRLLENPKMWGSENYFCLKMISKLGPKWISENGWKTEIYGF